MPFVATDKTTGDRIDITQITSPRKVLRPGSCACPLCGGDFIVKAGLITTAHFAHKATCTSDWKVHPQSAEHRAGKLFLVRNLPHEFEEYRTARIELEVLIPEIRRQADVLVTTDIGWIIAHEVQLASITTEELEERTNDYNSIGIDVVWWLGKRAATLANETWCYSVFGFCLGLEFDQRPAETSLVSASYRAD